MKHDKILIVRVSTVWWNWTTVVIAAVLVFAFDVTSLQTALGMFYGASLVLLWMRLDSKVYAGYTNEHS